MVLPPMGLPEPTPSEGQSDFLNFFSQAIERYKQSVIASGGEDERATSRNVPPKKRSSSYSAELGVHPENPSKMTKLSVAAGYMEPTDSSSTDGQNDQSHEGDVDIEKKRLASRVSSRRTREREKLRMDHFRNAKLKLQQENKKLQDENKEIRSLIQKIKDEKSFLDRKAAVVQSMIATNNPTHSQPSYPLQATQQGLPTPAIPLPQPPQQVSPIQTQQALAALLLNVLVQPQAGNNIAPVTSLPPSQPSQDQQLLSLLGLMSSNPALAQLLAVNAAQSQAQPPPPQPQPILSAALLGGFGSALGSNQVLGSNNNSLQQNLLSLLLSGGAGGQGGTPNAASHLGFLSVDNNSRNM